MFQIAGSETQGFVIVVMQQLSLFDVNLLSGLPREAAIMKARCIKR
jgi:hypothetical protein